VFIPATLQNGFVIIGIQPFWQQVVVGAVLIAAVYVDQQRRAAALRGGSPRMSGAAASPDHQQRGGAGRGSGLTKGPGTPPAAPWFATGPVRPDGAAAQRSSMKAVVYDAPGSYTITEVATPDPGPGEVRVRVQQTGICGTDLPHPQRQVLRRVPADPRPRTGRAG
jgi:hypothetical protein